MIMWHDYFVAKEHDNSVTNSKIKFTIPKKASIEFGILVSKIINELQQDEAENLEFIKDICCHLTIDINEENSDDTLLFTDDQLSAIRNCGTIRMLFRTKLRHCWRWDDFSFLKEIVQGVGSPECELLLKQYEQKLDTEMKLQEIYDSCEQEDRNLPEGYEEMVAIVSNKIFCRITKEEYDKMKMFTTKHCGVKPYVLPPFKRVSSSSLLIVWLIPSTAVGHMMFSAIVNVNNFIKESFVFLQIASEVLIDQRRCDVS